MRLLQESSMIFTKDLAHIAAKEVETQKSLMNISQADIYGYMGVRSHITLIFVYGGNYNGNS